MSSLALPSPALPATPGRHRPPAATALPSPASRLLALVALVAALLGTLLVSAPQAHAATLGTRVVAEASRHVGAPYRYGATGPSRFDCSGYTRYVYSRFGKRLPHNSTAQYRVSHKVSKSAKQPGDLIFMRSGSRITHVGIYAGAGRFWVAPKTGDHVKLQRIYTSNYLVGRV